MSEEIKKEKVRKVFLEDLPRWIKGEGFGNIGSINWSRSIGQRIKGIYGDIEFEIEIIEYKDGYLYVKYLDKELFKIKPKGITRCQLGKLLGLKTSEFKIEIGTTFKDKNRNMTIIDREVRIRYKKDKTKTGCNDKWYKYTCNKCGWTEGWIVESDLKVGNGCSCCCASPQIVVEHINSIVAKEETQWMIPYFQGGYDEAKLYTSQSNKKVYPICPDCGRIKDKPMTICGIYKSRSTKCSCGDGVSYPQKLVFKLLEQLGVDFKTEKTFDWCKFEKYNGQYELSIGKYDYYFMIDNKKYLLETDGEQHSKERSEKSVFADLKEQKYIDNMKDKLAKENGYEVIRIDCEKSNLNYIKQNILNSKLNEIFDLSRTDWKQCEEFALSNRVKEACELWDSGINSTKEISKEMKIASVTVCVYLKKGAELSWCNYKTTVVKREENIIKASQLWNTKKYSMKEINNIIKVNRKHLISYLNEGNKRGICDYTVELSNRKYLEDRQIKTKSQPKRIICIENGEVFVSGSEVQKFSEKMFGIKMYGSSVINNCNGKQDNTKGFHFKYISDLTPEELIKYKIINEAS